MTANNLLKDNWKNGLGYKSSIHLDNAIKKIVLDIRNDFTTGNYSQVELSKKYNLSTHIINKIVNRRSWKHI